MQAKGETIKHLNLEGNEHLAMNADRARDETKLGRNLRDNFGVPKVNPHYYTSTAINSWKRWQTLLEMGTADFSNPMLPSSPSFSLS